METPAGAWSEGKTTGGMLELGRKRFTESRLRQGICRARSSEGSDGSHGAAGRYLLPVANVILKENLSTDLVSDPFLKTTPLGVSFQSV